MARDRVDHAGERILLQPDLDVGVGVAPQVLAVEPGGFFERVLDTVEGAWLTLPARVVGEPIIRQRSVAPHDCEVGLHLGVAGLGLLDDSADGGLIEHLPHRHRLAGFDDGEQCLAARFDFGLSRADALYGASLIKTRFDLGSVGSVFTHRRDFRDCRPWQAGLVEVVGTWNAKQRSLRALFCCLLRGPALANGLLLLATQPRGNGGFSVNYLLVAQASSCWALPTLPPVLKRANGLFDFGCELIFGEIVFEN